MNISDFKADNSQDEWDIEKIKQSEEFHSVESEYSDLIEKFLLNYGKMSEEELMAEMLKIVAEKKKNGTFDANKVRTLADVLTPFLNNEQVAKMKNLLNFLE